MKSRKINRKNTESEIGEWNMPKMELMMASIRLMVGKRIGM